MRVRRRERDACAFIPPSAFGDVVVVVYIIVTGEILESEKTTREMHLKESFVS